MMRCCGTSIRDLERLLATVQQYPEEYDDLKTGASMQLVKYETPFDKEVKFTDAAEEERKEKLWANRYLKPSEVAVHNTPEDCWVSWNSTVRDLTPVITQCIDSEAADVILAEAGKDISHWFDKQGNLRGCVSRQSGTKIPYLPRGAVPQTYVEVYPSGLHPNFPDTPWWKERCYIVGYLTSNSRQISITNTLAVTTANITVCEEDTLELILMRYLMFNENASNYTWKYDGRILNMNKTMAQNNIPDYAQHFRQIGLPEDTYVPNIFLYYNDNI